MGTLRTFESGRERTRMFALNLFFLFVHNYSCSFLYISVCPVIYFYFVANRRFSYAVSTRRWERWENLHKLRVPREAINFRRLAPECVAQFQLCELRRRRQTGPICVYFNFLRANLSRTDKPCHPCLEVAAVTISHPER